MEKGFGDPNDWCFGYIAEELDQAGVKTLVTYDEKARPDGVKYEKVAIYVLEVVKQNAKTITEQQKKIEHLEGKVEELQLQQKQTEKTLAALEKKIAGLIP